MHNISTLANAAPAFIAAIQTYDVIGKICVDSFLQPARHPLTVTVFAAGFAVFSIGAFSIPTTKE